MIMGFTYECTYHDHESIIRTMNTMHGSVHLLYIQLVTNPHTYGFAAPDLKYI